MIEMSKAFAKNLKATRVFYKQPVVQIFAPVWTKQDWIVSSLYAIGAIVLGVVAACLTL